MEKNVYTFEDIEEITGLSRRTLQNYRRIGVLKGNSESGKRAFTKEETEAFMNDPYIFPALRAKQNEMVADFLSVRPSQAEICAIVLLPVENSAKANEISQNICSFLKKDALSLSFSFLFEARNKTAKIVLKGGLAQVQNVLKFVNGVESLIGKPK